MNLNDVYVNVELLRIEREQLGAPTDPKRWREEWATLTARPPRRALAAWAGDRLILIGERLRGWSAAGAPAIYPPPTTSA